MGKGAFRWNIAMIVKHFFPYRFQIDILATTRGL